MHRAGIRGVYAAEDATLGRSSQQRLTMAAHDVPFHVGDRVLHARHTMKGGGWSPLPEPLRRPTPRCGPR